VHRSTPRKRRRSRASGIWRPCRRPRTRRGCRRSGKGLRELGYVEGRDIIIEYRHENRDFERLPTMASELVASNIDVLVAVTTNAALAAKKTTSTVPIVFMGVTGPDRRGTGREPGAARRQQHRHHEHGGSPDRQAASSFLKETIPRVSRIAVLWDPQAPGSSPQWQGSQQPARDLGLRLYSMKVSSVDKYAAAFEAAKKAGNGAVWVTLNPLANSNQRRIAELAISHRMPTICARADYAENGCLIAYGPGYSIEGRDGARYVDKILKGVKPVDLRSNSRRSSSWWSICRRRSRSASRSQIGPEPGGQDH
jgi:putative ABC transport system substrate-binding protein